MMGTDFPSESPVAGATFTSEQPAPATPAARPPPLLRSNDGVSPDQPGSNGERFYTIQRVNGNGANGKGDGTAGGHKHTIEEGDNIKKNSVHRHFLKEEKERRKSLVRDVSLPSFMSCITLQAPVQTARGYPNSPNFMHDISGVGHTDIASSCLPQYLLVHDDVCALLLQKDFVSRTFFFIVKNLNPDFAQCRTKLTTRNRKPTTRKPQDSH